MSTSGDNPFASPEGTSYEPPQEEGGGSVIPRSSVDYMEAVSDVFGNPNWFVNILLAGVAFLLSAVIPVVGALFAWGYIGEIIGARAYGRTNSYPDFDLNRLGDYVMRGLWMSLAAFAVSMCVVPIMMLAWGVMAALMATNNDALAVVGFVIYFVMIIAGNLFVFFVTCPIVIRAGMLNDLVSAFDFKWIMDFIRKMWVELFLGGIVLYFVAMFFMLIGCLALCVGYIPAAGAVAVMGGLFITQLYQVYVYRGGEALPFKEATKL
ncbi:hypothetical protein C5Y96_16740 [Blastopirellula marina]|uniref:DUF4013 domain-containing protein n=1 Tax=Blastopirellula marina TaxID=124 RepID=A0A2S8F791_9BACT|nr:MULTISPECIES: DUF4013 domain-containing protein [Pirellulaceae]PQO28022.1 hypothetical protein C5Y96_16740 [Blastopirellula marina]RCS48447.1 DUF4013 domain-containing protein [Bremerella cremea]